MTKSNTTFNTNPLIIFLFVCLLGTSGFAQIGGRYTYEFLSMPQSARLTALGGSLITIADNDVSLAAANPSLLSDLTHNQISINHNFNFAGISHGYLGYGRKLSKYGINTHLGVNYISYGDFTAADELGNDLGIFTGNEVAVILGASRKLNERLTLGTNLKGIFGSFESYNSTGIALDIGLLYTRPESNIRLAFLIKNLGTELSSYGNVSGKAPLDIQIGFSQKLEHLPFRFSVILHQLQRWGIRYDDPNAEDQGTLFGEQSQESSAFSQGVDNFFRHFIFSGEFLLGKSQSFKLRIGYNHLRRKELSLSNFRSLSGFSTGFGIKVKGFQIDYGVGYHHLAGASNHISLSTDLGRFSSKSF